MDTAAVTAANTGPGPSLPVRAIATLLSTPGPYNPAASLPPKVVKVLELEFVEMSDLLADESMPADHPHSGRRTPAKPPVTEVRVWLECSHGCPAGHAFPREKTGIVDVPIDHHKGSP